MLSLSSVTLERRPKLRWSRKSRNSLRPCARSIPFEIRSFAGLWTPVGKTALRQHYRARGEAYPLFEFMTVEQIARAAKGYPVTSRPAHTLSAGSSETLHSLRTRWFERDPGQHTRPRRRKRTKLRRARTPAEIFSKVIRDAEAAAAPGSGGDPESSGSASHPTPPAQKSGGSVSGGRTNLAPSRAKLPCAARRLRYCSRTTKASVAAPPRTNTNSAALDHRVRVK
jgi:hypothetical protein